MSQFKVLTDILKKYRFYFPIERRYQKRIFKSKKRSLVYILREANIKTGFISVKINYYYKLKQLGLSIKLATSSKIINIALSTAVVIIIASGALTIGNYVIKSPTIATQGIITFVLGKATITSEDKTPRQIKVKDSVKKGMIIETAKNSVINFQYPLDKIIKINPNSKISINEISDTELSEFNLLKGSILTKLRKLKKNEKYQIRTLNAVASVRGTQFSVSYKSHKTEVIVIDGSVEVQYIDNNQTVHDTKVITSGQKAIITNKIVIKQNSKINSLTVEQISKLNFINNIDTLHRTDLTKLHKAHQIELQKLANKIQFMQGSNKYGHIYTIFLYNGRKIRGYIVSRAQKWKILTSHGLITIPSKAVKTTK